MDTGGTSKAAVALAAITATSGRVATATISGAAKSSGSRVALVPTGVGRKYAAATSPAVNSAPHRRTGRRQHSAATSRQTSKPLRACSSANDWRPPFPNTNPTTMVGTRPLTASVKPSRRRPARKSAPPATPRNKPATGLASAARTDSTEVIRRRPETNANRAPRPTTRPSVNVVRVTTRLPVRQTAAVIAPSTGRETWTRFNNAANSTTLNTYANAVVRRTPSSAITGGDQML